MHFKAQTLLISLLVLAAAPWLGWRYYQRSQPKTKPILQREEITLTILPGWNLRDVADYFVKKGVASSTADVYLVTGLPAVPFKLPIQEVRPEDSVNTFAHYNYEGYLAPETIRFFKGATVEEVVNRFFEQQLMELTEEMRTEVIRREITWHELLTIASLIEREARGEIDRRMVSDILWRRLQMGWAFQVDSSVHYIAGRSGDVFTTAKERDSLSLWNTYKYPGLPPGPISMPSQQSIMAALYPEKNSYWYFLTDHDGKMHYAPTLDEHNVNRARYLR